jgi:hypothetical protein
MMSSQVNPEELFDTVHAQPNGHSKRAPPKKKRKLAVR